MGGMSSMWRDIDRQEFLDFLEITGWFGNALMLVALLHVLAR
jgi:hypothetical protein